MAGFTERDTPAKVLYFTDSRGFGGTENMLLTIFAGLDGARWQPVLVHGPGSGFEQLDDGARTLGVRVWVVPQMNSKRGIGWTLPVAREFRAEKPAVFHAHRTTPNQGTYGLLAAVLARVPAVVVTQHHLYVQKEPAGRRLQAMLMSAGVDGFIAVSHEVARNLRPRCLFPSRVQVIHNGIQLRALGRPENPELRTLLTHGTQRPIVLCVARLDRKQKGLRFLVSAAALVPNAQFILAGDGPERPELEVQVRSLGIQDRVTLLGYWEDVPELLATCDLFVLPSLSEGFGLSVAEAMASGKAVVASDIGGLNEVVVHGETGLLVPPRDPAALADAIRTVLSDPFLAKRMGEAGRLRTHQQFSAETMIRRTTQVYERLLSGRHAAESP